MLLELLVRPKYDDSKIYLSEAFLDVLSYIDGLLVLYASYFLNKC
jgi:hypothetical protein